MNYKGYPIEVIRSNRKTISLTIKPGPAIILRAPLRAPLTELVAFISSKERWLDEHLSKIKSQTEKSRVCPRLTEADIDRLAKAAADYFAEGVRRYAPLVGVSYGRITIRLQKTRWGSCSSKGNLNFNCLLMLAPPEVRDYVIVHELCHRLEMNHSPRFWTLVAHLMPGYKNQIRWLSDHGCELMAAAGLN